MPAPDYERNANGQTFGSAAEAPAPELEPDLILVVSNEGPEGYVLKSELDAANGDPIAAGFKTLEDALRWQAERIANGPVSIPVYEADGLTQIGTFTIGIPDGEYVPAPTP